ncbi:MAG: hypothetical protein IPL61_04810 [Myxococcales bacterium]|nr:hypothetical protein [Myxococcales bacterium]
MAPKPGAPGVVMSTRNTAAPSATVLKSSGDENRNDATEIDANPAKSASAASA